MARIAKMTLFVSENAERSRLNPRLQIHSHDDQTAVKKTITQRGALCAESLSGQKLAVTNGVENS